MQHNALFSTLISPLEPLQLSVVDLEQGRRTDQARGYPGERASSAGGRGAYSLALERFLTECVSNRNISSLEWAQPSTTYLGKGRAP